jgi:deoxyribose-phosphate aldolase
MITDKELAKVVEHTNLNINTTESDIEKLCKEATENNFGGICIRGNMVDYAFNHLKDSGVYIVSVVGFPKQKCLTLEEMSKELSRYNTTVKITEAEQAIKYGAMHIDMVIDLASLKNKEWSKEEEDINSVVKSVKDYPVKVIIEACYLSDDEKRIACKVGEYAGAKYLKTSTGFGISGAKVPDLELMSDILSKDTGIKAAGGVKDEETLKTMYLASQKYKPHPFKVGASSLAY